MRTTKTDIYTEVINLYSTTNLTIKQLAERKYNPSVSLKRIRNIIYARAAKTQFEQEIKSAFRLAFLELQNIPAAIKYVYDNQPLVSISESFIRKILKT